MVIEVNPLQPSKAELPIDVTLFPRIIFLIEVLFLNQEPTVEHKMVTDFNPLQP